MLGLLLPVRQDLYAVGLDAVHEVLDLGADTSLTALPAGPASILGLVNVRGQVVPVLDTATLLDLPPLPDAERVAMALVQTARGLAALVTTALPFAQELGEGLGPSPLHGTAGRHRVGDRVATVLDVEALLAPERVAR